MIGDPMMLHQEKILIVKDSEFFEARVQRSGAYWFTTNLTISFYDICLRGANKEYWHMLSFVRPYI